MCLKSRVRMQDFVYEYIIVGGGMAGLHVAKLLAKKYPERSINIIEKYKDEIAYLYSNESL